MKPTANYTTAADAFGDWREQLLTGEPPTLYPVAQAGELAEIEIGPGLVTLIGGAPGAGKTAFTMQLVVDALRLSPTLRVLVCNIEMPPSVLLDRQLARLSGIDATTIRKRAFSERHADRLDAALGTLEALDERLAFVRPPFDLANVAASADAFGADVLLLDYIQRIPPPGSHGDKRGAVDASMNYLRQFADAGVAVIVVAAVSRGKDSKGRSSYTEINLASFRESGELEFGADDAFILLPDRKQGTVELRHLKSRHGDCRDLRLDFDGAHQTFTPIETTPAADQGKLTKALGDAWARTKPADDDKPTGKPRKRYAEFDAWRAE
jgi:replicative DNA helicase